jgi:hypothetical protein
MPGQVRRWRHGCAAAQPARAEALTAERGNCAGPAETDATPARRAMAGAGVRGAVTCGHGIVAGAARRLRGTSALCFLIAKASGLPTTAGGCQDRRGLDAVAPSPGNPFFEAETTTMLPTLVGVVTTTGMVLAGERVETTLGRCSGRKRQAGNHRQVSNERCPGGDPPKGQPAARAAPRPEHVESMPADSRMRQLKGL